jgi:hypothetical protein
VAQLLGLLSVARPAQRCSGCSALLGLANPSLEVELRAFAARCGEQMARLVGDCV